MDIKITRHGVPEKEFRQLKNLYYRGEYTKMNTAEWFSVRIDMSIEGVSQMVDLIWFMEWRV